MHQESWKRRYQAAKDSLRSIQASRQVDDETLALLDGLFVWEQDVARVRVCREDAVASAALVPLLDALRGQGICVLACGAIEDYYPASGAKPERALAASALITTQHDALALSRPLAEGRPTELQQVFEELLR